MKPQQAKHVFFKVVAGHCHYAAVELSITASSLAGRRVALQLPNKPLLTANVVIFDQYLEWQQSAVNGVNDAIDYSLRITDQSDYLISIDNIHYLITDTSPDSVYCAAFVCASRLIGLDTAKWTISDGRPFAILF